MCGTNIFAIQYTKSIQGASQQPDYHEPYIEPNSSNGGDRNSRSTHITMPTATTTTTTYANPINGHNITSTEAMATLVRRDGA